MCSSSRMTVEVSEAVGAKIATRLTGLVWRIWKSKVRRNLLPIRPSCTFTLSFIGDPDTARWASVLTLKAECEFSYSIVKAMSNVCATISAKKSEPLNGDPTLTPVEVPS